MQEVTLPEIEYEIVKLLYEKEEMDVDELAKLLERKREDLMRYLAELELKRLIETVHLTQSFGELSEKGRAYLERPLPEEVLLERLEGKEVPMKELREGLSKDEFSAALGRLKRFGVIEIVKGKARIKEIPESFKEYVQKLKACLRDFSSPKPLEGKEECFKLLKERGFIKVEKRKRIIVKITERAKELMSKGLIKKENIVTKLTPELIITGKWREVKLKKFDFSVEVPARRAARRHPLMELYEQVREILISMGFEEARGNFVEQALWNFDVLLVPQYHPARYETDVFYVENAKLPEPPKDVIERTKEEHEKLYRYTWRAEEALRLLLRTHTTAVSAREMYKRKGGEYRVFSLDRVFRSETLDPTHSMEFHQLEGIVVGKNVKFDDLLGFFVEFAKKMGLGEVKFKPAYFPFTEPSVEGFIKHPKLGWVEVFPGGVFRPGLLRAVGIDPKEYNVIAWGIGIDRLAMLMLELDDIRDLYSNNLAVIHKQRRPFLL
ncbi:phenylalanyl-tRNA synthetase subunit alpha [Ignicoccus pacificus DSM 13166]|uniref:phenylalanine--tRNA ligase n=1 Tax=Ignicoccus pacificus DSM 13166 TaxID=940294 RepID=A0A977K9U4_9CREN|nr:phenylalanyl-tRNA synthetase subunit alpha [Ignicoccus pacificus DSM 13166]